MSRKWADDDYGSGDKATFLVQIEVLNCISTIRGRYCGHLKRSSTFRSGNTVLRLFFNSVYLLRAKLNLMTDI